MIARAAGLLAKSFTELIEEGPAEPVAFTEAGDAVPEALVWTGITKDGVAAGGERKLKATWVVTIPNQHELVGGNRRES